MAHLVELLDQGLAEPVKRVSESLRRAQKVQRALEKALKQGDIPSLRRGQAELEELVAQLGEAARSVRCGLVHAETAGQEPEAVDAYARAFEEACRAQGLTVEGDFPTYWISPFQVEFDLERHMVVVHRRGREHALRPEKLAARIHELRRKFEHEPFDPSTFRKALLTAHQLLAQNRPQDSVSLKKIYSLLALMRSGTGAKGYTIEQFAWDIFRLRQDSLIEGDFRLVFIHGRENAILVPSEQGRNERFTALQLQGVS